MRSVTPDMEKFRELVVYIACLAADDPSFGDVKLNKALYFSDFFAYSHLGRPITGARYFKLEHGPAARALLPVRGELATEGAVRVEERPVGPKTARVTVALRPADTSLFSRDELELVDDVVRQLKGRTAVAVSAVSHRQSAGWNLVELEEDIPYPTALLSSEGPSPETIASARGRAAEAGWV